MIDDRALRGPIFYVQNTVGSALVVFAMLALWWQFGGEKQSDWLGYAQIWEYDGSWLVKQGRDPIFVAIVHAAKTVFGPDGYSVFRIWLDVLFMGVSAGLAYAMPSRRFGPLTAATIVIAAVMMKFVVQIREGLAFALICWSLVGVFHRARGGWAFALVCSVLAAGIHSGMSIFTGTFVASSLICLATDRFLIFPWIRLALTAAGVSMGAAVATALIHFSGALEFALRDLGADTTAQVAGGVWKTAYWSAVGLAVLILRTELLQAGWGARKFGAAYAMVLGCMVLPGLYVVCATLVFSNFYLPAATSLSIRLLLSSMGMGLIIVGLRGSAGVMTLGISLALIADSTRLLVMHSW